MAGKRKELFLAARNEQGGLVMYFPHSNIVVNPSDEFWEVVIDELEPYIDDEDEITPQEDKEMFKEVRDIIQDFIENW